MRPSVLWHLYRARLRAQPLHELLAVVGIATGVALVFAVLVANSSVAGSVDQLVRAIVGDATVEVAARSDRGIDARLARSIAAAEGVAVAAPVLERRVTLRGPGGDRTVLLVGATYALARLGGPMTRGIGADGLRLTRSLFLTRSAAEAAGVRPGSSVAVETGARTTRAAVALALDRSSVGSLAGSPLAISSLGYVQELAARPGRVTRVIVRAEPGREAAVRERLAALAGAVADVRPSDTEARLVRQAARPNDQSTSLFAAISAAVGFLFALNAMLLTVPARRRLIRQLRLQGFSAPQIGSMLAFDALVLGVAGSLLGLLLGDLLSRYVFESVPGYLSFAFPVGEQRVVPRSAVLVAVAAGLLGSLLAAAQPFAAIYRPPRARASTAERRRPDGVLAAGAAGIALLLVTVWVSLRAPSATIVGIGALVLSLLLLLPLLLRALTAGAAAIAPRLPSGALIVAVGELRESTVRATALAATAALAVFATTAIEGAHRDLLRGLDEAARGLTHTSDVWVAPSGVENTLTTLDFEPPATVAALERADGVVGVRAYQGGFLDVGGRRLWVIGRPAGDRPMIPDGQVVDGDRRLATARLRDGGWAAVSDAVARERGLRLGQPFALPAPAGPLRLRLAATLTNVGWAPGTVIVNQRDYSRGWRTSAPSAIEVDLAPGLSPAAGVALVRDALGPPGRALAVETAAERWEALRNNARQGLGRLTQISTLLLIGAILATAAAVSATVWQRRGRLAELRTQGFSLRQVWFTLLAEAGLLLAFGCLVGAAFGLGGQRLLSRWLVLSTGFPADYSAAVALAAFLVTLVGSVALIVIALPGYLAARAPLALGIREK